MKLEPHERNSLQEISVFCTENTKVVSEVFKSLLRTITVKLYEENNKIVIPFLGELFIENLDFSLSTQKNLKFIFEPSKILLQELEAIINKKEPNSKLEFKEKIEEELNFKKE